MEQSVNIRTIQHYMYCPRRYALLEVNDDWSENYFVVKANLMHENVHSGKHSFSDSRKIVKSSVAIYNDNPKYNLYGIADCIEFVRNKSGTFIPSLDGYYDVNVVEYKPTPPKTGEYNETDVIQVFAQKLCVDYIFGCESNGVIYYSEARKRVNLPLNERYIEYDELIKELLVKMHEITEKSIFPPKVKGQKCSGCSMRDLCFAKDGKGKVRDIIMAQVGGDKLSENF